MGVRKGNGGGWLEWRGGVGARGGGWEGMGGKQVGEEFTPTPGVHPPLHAPLLLGGVGPRCWRRISPSPLTHKGFARGLGGDGGSGGLGLRHVAGRVPRRGGRTDQNGGIPLALG